MNAKTEIPLTATSEDVVRIAGRYNPIFDKNPSLMLLNIASVLNVVQKHLDHEDRLELDQYECGGLALILKTINNAIEVHGEVKRDDMVKAMGGAA